MLLPFKAHRADPASACYYEVIKGARTILRHDLMARALFEDIWFCPKGTIPGPVQTMKEATAKLGWSYNGNLEFSRPMDTPIGILEGSDGWWYHEVRRSIRWALANNVATRRDTGGLKSNHVAMQATCGLMRGKVPKAIKDICG
jgi:hypothetical protein